MRILFIYPNQDKFPFPIAPIGILILSAIIRDKGHKVAVTDLMFSNDPKTAIKNDIDSFKPDVIAISIRNYNNQNPLNFVCYIDCIREYVDFIRLICKATIICGGAGFTRLPEQIFKETGVDYGLCGEAEESFPVLIEHLATDNKEMTKIPGIVLRKEDKVVRTPWIPVNNLNNYPFQDVSLIDYEEYIRNGGYVAVETKRGCPNSCIYCDDSLIYGKTVRVKSPLRVVDEIAHITNNFGYRDFYFADSLFTLPPEHFYMICKEILKRDLKIRFEIEAVPIGITQENVKLLKQAGCIGVFFGIDSGSPKILAALQKNFTVQDIKRVASIFSRAGLPYAVCINFGGPGETMKTFDETISLLKSLPDYSAVFMNIGFKIEKGTLLAQLALKEGVINKNTDLARNGSYFAPGFDASFAKKINELCSENPGWIPIYPKTVDQADDTFEGFRKLGKRKKTKPAWIKSKELFYLLKILNKSPAAS